MWVRASKTKFLPGAVCVPAAVLLLFALGCGDEPDAGPTWFYITTQDSGLPSDSVYGIFSGDVDAWYATDAGLAYNRGPEWRVYDRTSGFPTDLVYDVAVLPSGDVWAATDAGVVRIRGSEIKTFSVADGLPAANVWSAVYDGAKVWFGTEAGLARFDDPGFTVIGAAKGLPGDDVRDVYAVGVDRIWAACIGGGAYYDRGHVTAYTPADDGLPTPYVYAAAARGNDAWFGTAKGLCLYRSGALVKIYSAANAGLKSDVINDVAYAAGGELWVGTASGAARRMGETFETFDRGNGMTEDYVLTLCCDKLDYIWMGTLGGGVNGYHD